MSNVNRRKDQKMLRREPDRWGRQNHRSGAFKVSWEYVSVCIEHYNMTKYLQLIVLPVHIHPFICFQYPSSLYWSLNCSNSKTGLVHTSTRTHIQKRALLPTSNAASISSLTVMTSDLSRPPSTWFSSAPFHAAFIIPWSLSWSFSRWRSPRNWPLVTVWPPHAAPASPRCCSLWSHWGWSSCHYCCHQRRHPR